jgi:hypothetical protein
MNAKTLAVVVSTALLLSMSGAANSAEEEKKCGLSIEVLPGNVKSDCTYNYKRISVGPGQINLYNAGAVAFAAWTCTRKQGVGGCVSKALAIIERVVAKI